MKDQARAFHSTRVEVAVTEPDRPLTPMTQEQAKEWAHHCGGVEGIGPPITYQRKETYDQLVAALIAIVGFAIVAGVLLWVTGFLVDTFWTRS